MATITELNNGQVRSNPYGNVSQIPPSFSNVEYYDCYIPYTLRNSDLGGYAVSNVTDTETGQVHAQMPDRVKNSKVVRRVTLQNFDNYGNIPFNGQTLLDFDQLEPYINNGTISRSTDSDNCYILSKNGVQFYQSAMSPFFFRRSVYHNTPNDGFYSWSTVNRGQLFDVILTDGTCIHFVVCDVGQMKDTIGGDPNMPGGSSVGTEFATLNYSQYANIESCVSGCTLEMRGVTAGVTADTDYFIHKFAQRYGLQTDYKNTNNDTVNIAFVRMYHAKIQEGTFTVNSNAAASGSSVSNKAYKLNLAGTSTPDPDPGDTPVDPDPDEPDNPVNPDPSDDPVTPVIFPTAPAYEVEETIKGIKNLLIDFDVWKRETKLGRLKEYVVLRTERKDGVMTWIDETNGNKTYTKEQLKSHFGISYTSVNNHFRAKFEVVQAPLPPELGGTGTYDLTNVYKAIAGISAGSYDTTSLVTYETSSDSIELPSLLTGHVLTVEAKSETRGSAEVGDQGQASATSLDIEGTGFRGKSGEVSFSYDRNISEFTNVYRLMAPTDPIKNAELKAKALIAANHACFLAQNPQVGYNFYAYNQSKIWNYIIAQKEDNEPILFGHFNVPGDTNCINLCKLAYATVLYDANDWKAKVNLSTSWTTAGILTSHILENLGFTKLDRTYANVGNNLEIGDILIKNGHAAMVVGVGGKDWKVGSYDYNPKLGEVKNR